MRNTAHVVSLSASAADNNSQQLSSSNVLILSDNAPSWQELQKLVHGTPTGSRLQTEETLRQRGQGPPHTDALLRLFQEKDETNVRVTLYRDHAGWCPYCQKVWLLLELKQIPYRVQKVPMNAYGDKPAWYTRKVDGGKLPALELDGELHVESLDIMKLLDQTFPNPPMMIPDDDETNNQLQHQRYQSLLSLEQALQQDWFSLVFYPVSGEALQKANKTMLHTLAKVDQELSVTDRPWFLGGDTPSLVDIQYIADMERIIPSVLYWKGWDIRSCTLPHFQRWLTAWEALPAYTASRSDYYTHMTVIPSQNGPGYMIPEAKRIASRISGLVDGAWHLPLPQDSLEQFQIQSSSTTIDDNNPAIEAAYKLVKNHVNITQFACRGAGEPGRPAFHAELADPYAEPNEEYVQGVDVCLRHVTHALVAGSSVAEATAQADLAGKQGNDALRENWEAYPDENDPSLTYYWNYENGEVTWTPPTQQLDTCLTYLRDRIGVPRDMSGAAAMQLRAYLNWAVDMMRKS
ncbi:IN2-1 homolog B [Seminavis robusta]|uniref:IN2-1 homolog B n=1 Tax=Seminavis robusta TaxID=568900 RepID=A0A9N8DX01_9STRA|nr:IN2-1 homolog B [Seminavis robusta]|eukprot:Sro408_g136930.1 IN2-1 homolog B (519) ;mRNA; f:28624-30282